MRLDRRFLDFFVRTPSFFDQVRAQGSTNYAAIRPADVLGYAIPLPPLDEQRHIVARIEQLAVRIEEARGLRRAAMEEAERLAQAAADRALMQYRTSAPEVLAESIARSITDGDHLPPPKADIRPEGGIPFIFIRNITTGKLNLSDCMWVSPEYFSGIAASRVPEPGDVLYAAVGATYGTPCIVDTDQPFCFQRHIAIIKPDRTCILPEYLWWVLSSQDVYRQATAAVTGSAQPTVPLRGIRKLRFPLPSLPEQHRIVAHLSGMRAGVEALQRLQAETAAELDALLPSVLDKAFRGEL